MVTARRIRRVTRRILLPAVTAAAMLATATVHLASAVPAAAAAADSVAVDLSHSTGAFRGGASGTLYGLSDNGVPSQPVLDGAHITNTSQKPPDGAQHPNGDVLQVEKPFFGGAGKDIYVYVQDEYPDWPYNGGKRPGDANNDGVWDYLPILQSAVEKIATTSAHPDRYVFIPFNEPDGGNWYANWSTMKDQFLADWSAAYTTIENVYAAYGLGHARIGGPGDAVWERARQTDFLTYAKAHDQLPDIEIWHELSDNDLATFRTHMDQYRALLSSLSLPSIPVDITEYGLLHDMGVPGFLIQWQSMFEDEKVDAQTAYWNYAGNLDDNSSRTNGGNAGWWLMKWYGDLTGTQTVALTPPQPNVANTVQGIATLDSANKKATVLLGGGSSDVNLDVTDVDTSAFGPTVHVQVRADRLNGAEGASLEPPVVLSTNLPVVNGGVSLTISNSDPTTAYQVQITPALADPQPVNTDLVNSTEAENATLTNATVYYQDPNNDWGFPASNNHDVGSFNKAGSSATWPVTVPHDGNYRLSVLSGANQAPGEHALFVDGTFNQIIHYSADLGWTYRGTTDVTVPLTAGTHTLSIRASNDGSSTLPGADITLDRFDLYDVTRGENAVYPATDARLTGGATLDYSPAQSAGDAALSGSQSATWYAATAATGYYDVAVHYATSSASTIALQVNGSTIAFPATRKAGTWTSTVRVYLPQGINELALTAPDGALVSDVTTSRGAGQEQAGADPANVDRVPATDLVLSGTAKLNTIPASSGSNGVEDASGDVQEVGYIGNGANNSVSFARPSTFGAGQYVLTVAYANAERDSGINYNPQVVTRFLDVSEAGGATTRMAFRHNYSWTSFWDKSAPVTLTTSSGALTLGNASAYGPDVNEVTLSKLIVGNPRTSATSSG